MDVAGPLSSTVCSRCGGAVLATEGAQRLFDELGHTVQQLRELAELVAGQRFSCVSCASKTSPLVLKGAQVDLCFGCGALWVDRGELERISAARYTLPIPIAAPVVVKPSLPPANAALVTLERRPRWFRAGRFALGTASTLGLMLSAVGVAPVAWLGWCAAGAVAAALMLKRPVTEILPRTQRVLRWTGFVPPTQAVRHKMGEAFSSDAVVVARPLRLSPMRARAHPARYYHVELVEPDGRLVAHLDTVRRRAVPALVARRQRALGVASRVDGDAPAPPVFANSAAALLTALHWVLRPSEVSGAAGRRIAFTDASGVTLGTATSQLHSQSVKPRLLDVLLEQWRIADANDDSESVRLYAAEKFGHVGVSLVHHDGSSMGYAQASPGAVRDSYTWWAPARAWGMHGEAAFSTQHIALVELHTLRPCGQMWISAGDPGKASVVTVTLTQPALSARARYGILALALHASLVSASSH